WANGDVTFASGLDTAAFLADWARFYQEIFGITADLSRAPLPAYRLGFHWGVAVVPGITTQQAYEKCKERFSSWKYTDQSLDQAVPRDKDDRTVDNGSYVVWCRPRVEADEEHKNLSAKKIAERRDITTMTLLERLLLELWFHYKTSGHLDIKNYTLCSGSRGSGGSVPRVDWYGGYDRLRVYWGSVGDCYDSFRAREVVSVADAKQAA
ncbi:MAG: hypothetical protein AAB452_01325, partial [Patescibacteria group bacterium]